MTLRLVKSNAVASGVRERTPGNSKSDKSVFVVFTSYDQTLQALEKAAEIAKPLNLNIVVVVAQIVPFPLSLDNPPTPMKLIARQFEEWADHFSEEAEVRVYLCRNSAEIFKRILRIDCPAVIGFKKKKWWQPLQEEKLVRSLRRAGFCLISVETD